MKTVFFFAKVAAYTPFCFLYLLMTLEFCRLLSVADHHFEAEPFGFVLSVCQSRARACIVVFAVACSVGHDDVGDDSVGDMTVRRKDKSK